MTLGSTRTKDDWYTFVCEAELVKHHKRANHLSGVGFAAPNPLVDGILPSLLYVRLGSLLDHALKEFISAKQLQMSHPYRRDFNGRISFMEDQGLLLNPASWHSIREKRNELAHELWNKCSWDDLQRSIDCADAELVHLGLATPRPEFEFFGERNPVTPTEPDVVLKFDYCYGLKVHGKKVIEVTWSTNHYGLAGPQTKLAGEPPKS